MLIIFMTQMKSKAWNSSSATPQKHLQVHFGGKPFVEYEKNEDLEKLLTNKRVAFVGPSSHLSGSKSGELIDSYDVVIRLGQCFSIPESSVEDIGERTDIVCHSFNILQRKEYIKHIDYFKTLKHVICSMVSLNELGQQNEFFPKLIAPVHNVDDRYMLKIWDDVGTVVNSGLAAMIVLMNYDIKEMYVTGISFYNMGKFGDIYYDDYMGAAKKTGTMRPNFDKKVAPKEARADLHNQGCQIEYFRNMVNENPDLIKLDEYLKKNL
jgi:hypothetical protein